MAESRILAIGGIGGSGTRVGAAIMQSLGYYIGSDLNEALDNLWFTFLFKRRSILLESEMGLSQLFDLFFRRMYGDVSFKKLDYQCLERLAKRSRLQHPAEWLRERYDSFIKYPASRNTATNLRWGWKEPNTHIIADSLLSYSHDLKYIHFQRDPFYMAHSKNQNQLANWGSIFFDDEIAPTARSSLRYWCAVHKRIAYLKYRYPTRVHIIDYDVLCRHPLSEVSSLLVFLNEDVIDKRRDDLITIVRGVRESAPIKYCTDAFDQESLYYLNENGFV